MGTKRDYEVKNFVREWRVMKHLSIEKLAIRAGISGAMLSQLERGKTTYTQATLEKLAEALDVRAWQLLASGPEENQALWEHVLSVTVPSTDLDAIPPGEREALRDMMQNHYEAMMKTSRKWRMYARDEAKEAKRS